MPPNHRSLHVFLPGENPTHDLPPTSLRYLPELGGLILSHCNSTTLRAIGLACKDWRASSIRRLFTKVACSCKVSNVRQIPQVRIGGNQLEVSAAPFPHHWKRLRGLLRLPSCRKPFCTFMAIFPQVVQIAPNRDIFI